MSITQFIELPLFRSSLSEDDIQLGCEVARQQGYAAVIVLPCDLDQAVRWIGSEVQLATFIEGTGTTSVKAFATRDAVRRGAREVETMLNSRKLRSRQFQYLEVELTQMVQACHESGARLKVHIESENLDEELKILACRISRRASVDCLATKNASDLPLLRDYARERFQLKFVGEVAGLDALQVLRDAGCSRVEIVEPAPLVAAYRAQEEAQLAAQRQAQTAS